MVKPKTTEAKLLDIVKFVMTDGWEFEFNKVEDTPYTTLEIAIFEGRLRLNSDGTWDYV